MSFRPRHTLVLLALLATGFAGCGKDDEKTDTAAQEGPDLSAVKKYLTDHTADLKAQVAILNEQGERYYELAEMYGFDYEKMLEEDRGEVQDILATSKAAYAKANPAYEEAEGVVAGVQSLAEYDVIIDAGSDGSDPENAVPFNLKTPKGRELKQPGNLFFLTETALYGTNPDLQAKGVKADIDGDGKVEFGEGLPDADTYVATTRKFDEQAKELDASAQKFNPTPSDAFSALVVMTPTMSEYFEAWKNSRFVAGSKAKEQSFVAASRLQDIADILGGLVFTYDSIKPQVEGENPAAARQIEEGLKSLESFAARLRDQEADGKKFTAEEADALGSRAQEQAEAIAGQITQAAQRLNIEIKEG